MKYGKRITLHRPSVNTYLHSHSIIVGQQLVAGLGLDSHSTYVPNLSYLTHVYLAFTSPARTFIQPRTVSQIDISSTAAADLR